MKRWFSGLLFFSLLLSSCSIGQSNTDFSVADGGNLSDSSCGCFATACQVEIVNDRAYYECNNRTYSVDLAGKEEPVLVSELYLCGRYGDQLLLDDRFSSDDPSCFLWDPAADEEPALLAKGLWVEAVSNGLLVYGNGSGQLMAMDLTLPQPAAHPLALGAWEGRWQYTARQNEGKWTLFKKEKVDIPSPRCVRIDDIDCLSGGFTPAVAVDAAEFPETADFEWSVEEGRQYVFTFADRVEKADFSAIYVGPIVTVRANEYGAAVYAASGIATVTWGNQPVLRNHH